MQLSGGPQTLCVTLWWFSGSGSKALQSPLWLKYYVNVTFFNRVMEVPMIESGMLWMFFRIQKTHLQGLEKYAGLVYFSNVSHLPPIENHGM